MTGRAFGRFSLFDRAAVATLFGGGKASAPAAALVGI